MTITLVLGIGSIGLAIAIRNSQRARTMRLQLIEEQRRRTEAELTWLKNQLNPHFPFNCLNNISSLIYLDSDKAQDCIGRLSDLLRYDIYDSQEKTVPLRKEIEFIRNYIELMSLRYDDNTVVDFECDIQETEMKIIPLVFIPLIENAFKHGVSASRKSEIHISMSENDRMLVFICENTNNSKSDSDRSGNGVGLPNTRKRLDIIYGDRCRWEQYSDEETFRVELYISL